jgi:hypothetical protein
MIELSRACHRDRVWADRSRHRLGIASAVVGCALAIAACGSSNNPSVAASTAATLSNGLVEYAHCMRSHGVPEFPDPGTTQGPNAFGIDGYTFNLPTNLNPESPAYQDANQACRKLIPGASGSGHGIPEKAKQAALDHAECMRDHGVPNYPDPTFSGGGMSQSLGGPGLNPRSPAFQQAQKICRPH